jgi:Spy/CpxP family protein refolding chaperone
MTRHHSRTHLTATVLIVLVACTHSASAQGPSGQFYRLFGEISTVTLAQLDEVSAALKLNDEQKTSLAKLNDELNRARFEAFQDAQGDFEGMRDDVAELYTEFHGKVAAVLDDAQQKKADEIYVQVNGPTALSSSAIATELKLTDEQKQKLADASIDHTYDVFDSFQDMQGMSDEERAKEVEEMIKSRDESLLKVLTDEQKEQFANMAGEKVDVDLNKLPMPGQR